MFISIILLLGNYKINLNTKSGEIPTIHDYARKNQSMYFVLVGFTFIYCEICDNLDITGIYL